MLLTHGNKKWSGCFGSVISLDMFLCSVRIRMIREQQSSTSYNNNNNNNQICIARVCRMTSEALSCIHSASFDKPGYNETGHVYSTIQ